MMCLPQDLKVINGYHCITTNGAKTGDYISTKTFKKIWVMFKFLQTGSHATVCSIYEATDVTPTSADAVTAVMPNWKNADTATTDTLTKGTDAATVTLTAGATNQIVIMEVDPVILTADHDCIAGYTSSSSDATNFVDITYFGLTRYPQGTPPTAITD
jgi:hypothetical protein